MGNTILTPLDFSVPIQSGKRRFWKQLLPVTSIDYKGTQIDFDPAFHKDLALSFEGKAFDQVPLVFADGDNKHNEDPRNFGGELLDVKYRGPSKGTWGLIEADPEAAKAIEKNPKLGVSARILQGVKKADGREFPRAIRHVLMTMNPRVSGMEPWQAVDLSNEDSTIEVVDLTAATFEEGNIMARSKTKTTSAKEIDLSKVDLSTISDEDFQSLLDLAQTALDEDVDVDEDEDDEIDDLDVETPGRKTRRKKSKTKITVEKDSEDDGDDDEEEDEDETDLSDTDHVIKRGEVSQFRQMRLDLAATNWKAERGELLRAGVPPFLLDLAEPVLSQPDALTIDLADGDEIDATATIRKMLTGVKAVVDLSGEIGHQVDLSEVIEKDDEATQFLDAWDKQYG